MLLSVLIPCLNEAENLPRLERELIPVLERLAVPWELLVVDDGSRDATPALLKALPLPGLRVLTHPENRGLGAALRTGLIAARGEWVVFLDADLTFHPEAIADLLEAQRRTGADCVCGSPFLGGMPGVPWSRRLPSLLLNAFYRGFFDRRVTAYTPMFRLYRTAALRGLRLSCDGFEISTEILVGLLRAGGKVTEIPVPLTVRTGGVSKLRRLRELRNHAVLAWRLLTGPG